MRDTCYNLTELVWGGPRALFNPRLRLQVVHIERYMSERIGARLRPLDARTRILDSWGYRHASVGNVGYSSDCNCTRHAHHMNPTCTHWHCSASNGMLGDSRSQQCADTCTIDRSVSRGSRPLLRWTPKDGIRFVDARLCEW